MVFFHVHTFLVYVSKGCVDGVIFSKLKEFVCSLFCLLVYFIIFINNKIGGFADDVMYYYLP